MFPFFTEWPTPGKKSVTREAMMGVDPVEAELDERGDDGAAEATYMEVEPAAEVQFVDTIEASPGWNQKRVDLANYMWENQ